MSPQIEYRTMQDADYTEVLGLWSVTEGMGLDPVMDSCDGICSYLKGNPGYSWVAVCGGKIVGTVLAGTDGRRGYLMHLAVNREQRGSGIGRALVDKSVQSLCRDGINKVHVFVFKDNVSGADFWRHLGWVGRDDLLMLSLELDECGRKNC